MVVKLPTTRGKLTDNQMLSDLTWLRVGGPAEYFFQPSDLEDLMYFLSNVPDNISLFPIGVGSNLLVRDGGIKGVVIRLGKGFNSVEVSNGLVVAGAAALDSFVARRAADNGYDLTFLRTIPGSIGGALKMNAGCYGKYISDYFVSAKAVNRSGEVVTLEKTDVLFSYRNTDLSADLVVVSVTFAPPSGEVAALYEKMRIQKEKRDSEQPTKEITAGSTFRNPCGFSSSGHINEDHEFKAWKVIEDAGLRGFQMGAAKMHEKHPNFLTNTGGATASELEEFGELVRKRVFKNSGIDLKWEIIRVGDP
ncbi:MAG: UDP-N-acetylenolpyruvoylglucosamine reductase [Rhodobacteraceae bacterium]|nr:UDP-N-acetylenolpyruvoylglucosamine reductase [Paracoccaceae bacterium]